MACCLMAPSHYLNQCWLLICQVVWYSPESSFEANVQAICLHNKFENYTFKITATSPSVQSVKHVTHLTSFGNATHSVQIHNEIKDIHMLHLLVWISTFVPAPHFIVYEVLIIHVVIHLSDNMLLTFVMGLNWFISLRTNMALKRQMIFSVAFCCMIWVFLFLHMKVWRKWPPFCRLYQLCFRAIFLKFVWISWKLCFSRVPIANGSLFVQLTSHNLHHWWPSALTHIYIYIYIYIYLSLGFNVMACHEGLLSVWHQAIIWTIAVYWTLRTIREM